MAKKENIFIRIFETFVMLMILLVLIQTLGEDLSVVLGAPGQIIHLIKLSAFAFDLFFTIEFFIRLIGAIIRKKGRFYFFHNNGWIDLLASIPLLLLVSGPYLLTALDINIFQFDVLDNIGLLKLIKAIRVTRILRFLRVLKIFGKIKNVESKMAQRHISYVSTIVIFSIIIMITCGAVLKEVGVLPSFSQVINEREQASIKRYVKKYNALKDGDKISLTHWYDILAGKDKTYDSGLAGVKYTDYFIYIDKPYYSQVELENLYRSGSDRIKSYAEEQTGIKDLVLIYSREDQVRMDAAMNIINFVMIIFLLLSILFIYTRHFAQTVTDPIYVMRNGFEKMDYTLAVKVPENYRDDDIFILSQDYNKRWLPAKMRKIDEMQSKKSSLLSLDDVFKM